MIDIEEKGSRKEKIKYVSKIVAITLISTSAILGITLRLYMSGLMVYVYGYGPQSVWDVYYLFYIMPIFIIIIYIVANSISIPGFIALGIYSYFLYLKLEYYLFLRSETKYDPKLRFRTFYIALMEVGVLFMWCIFGAFLLNFLVTGVLIISLGILIIMIIVPGMYYLLERLK